MERSDFENRARIFVSMANARNKVIAFAIKQGMNNQIPWFVNNGYLKKFDQNKNVIAYEIIKEPVFYVYEEHHTLEGQVTEIKPVGEIELSWRQFSEIYQEIYLDKNTSVLEQWLESFKYFGYTDFEIRDNLYFDCVDKDFRFKRPHIIFSFNKVS